MCFGVDTWLEDWAFARFWRILRGGLAHYRLDKSLRPPLESHQNHRKILESYAICLKPESSFLSLRGEAEAIHKNNAESMDCHADKSARNDRKTAPSKKVDSRKTAQNPQSHILQTPQNKQAEVVFDSESQAAGFCKSATILSEQPKDSRILEIESGLFKDSQGRIL